MRIFAEGVGPVLTLFVGVFIWAMLGSLADRYPILVHDCSLLPPSSTAFILFFRKTRAACLRLSTLGVDALSASVGTCKRWGVYHAYGSDSLCARFSVSALVSWDGRPLDHAGLVVTLSQSS